jgi:hypothetical protein
VCHAFAIRKLCTYRTLIMTQVPTISIAPVRVSFLPQMTNTCSRIVRL